MSYTIRISRDEHAIDCGRVCVTIYFAYSVDDFRPVTHGWGMSWPAAVRDAIRRFRIQLISAKYAISLWNHQHPHPLEITSLSGITFSEAHPTAVDSCPTLPDPSLSPTRRMRFSSLPKGSQP